MLKMRLIAVAVALSITLPQRPVSAQADTPPSGSSAFCLFEFPPDGEKRIWVNLDIVQYIELRPSELRIYFGGGNLGSGHELRMPIANKEEGFVFMKRMQATATSCGVAATPVGQAAPAAESFKRPPASLQQAVPSK